MSFPAVNEPCGMVRHPIHHTNCSQTTSAPSSEPRNQASPRQVQDNSCSGGSSSTSHDGESLPQSLQQPPLELLCGYAVARCRRSPKCTRKKDCDISFARTLGKLLEEPYRFMPREHAVWRDVWRDRKRPFSGRRPVGLDPFSYPGFDVAAGRPHVDVVWILLVQRSGSRRIFIATRKQNLMGTAGLRYVATWKSDSRFARGAKDEGWGEALDTAIDGGMVQELASHEVYWLASSPTPSTSSATAISCKYRGMMVCKKS